MIEDPDFQAEIKERNILLAPLTGAELQSRIDKTMATPAEEIDKAKALFQEILAEINA